MESRSTKKPVISRKVAYGILFAMALLFALCLMWFAVRAMAGANPWFSAIGIAAAAVYVVIVLTRNNPLRSFRAPPPDGSARPTLRIVKK
jgi:membrane protein YdbS with pleckstrin-like domain